MVGKTGVAAIEVKTRRKKKGRPGFEEHVVTYDGQRLIWPWGEDRCGIDQVVAQADWLREFISAVFPGNGTIDPGTDGLPGPGRRRLRGLAPRGAWAGRAPRPPVARRAAPPARPHPDHPPRLRRGLERDRQVDGRAARHAPRRGRAAAGGRYVVFRCADPMEARDGRARYYESIDLDDAYHPQTILAYELNDKALPVRRRAAPPAGRAPARLQAGQVRHARSSWWPTSTRSAAARAVTGRTKATSGTPGSE